MQLRNLRPPGSRPTVFYRKKPAAAILSSGGYGQDGGGHLPRLEVFLSGSRTHVVVDG